MSCLGSGQSFQDALCSSARASLEVGLREVESFRVWVGNMWEKQHQDHGLGASVRTTHKLDRYAFSASPLEYNTIAGFADHVGSK
jgi:hypothetical protein